MASSADICDTAGHVVGSVTWDGMGRHVEVGADVYLPAAFELRCAGGADQPTLVVSFEVRNGTPECVGVELASKPKGRRTMPADLKTVAAKMNQWTEACSRVLMKPGKQLSEHERVIMWRAVGDRHGRQTFSGAQKKARAKITDEMLQEVAAVYNANPHGAWQAICDRFGVTTPTAGRYVQKARAAGHLPATTQGKRT